MNEAGVYRNVNLANYRAWEFGRFLMRAKDEIGHGRFQTWRASAFSKLNQKKAERCQELFTRNSKTTVLSLLNETALNQWVADLDQGSVRKFRLGYVPAKERPKLRGNRKFPRLMPLNERFWT